MYFNKEIFEKLLFKLNENVYFKIEEKIIECILVDNNYIKTAFEVFDFYHLANAGVLIEIPNEYEILFSATLVLNYFSDDYNIKKIKNIVNPIIGFEEINTGWRKSIDYQGNTIVINIGKSNDGETFDYNHRIDSYKIPLEYVLGYNKENILKNNSYQIYMHTIVPKNKTYTEEFIVDNAYKYIGRTKRTWQRRYTEHLFHAKIKKSLFHRAINGEICEIGMNEHCVEKAGLTRDEAYNLEKREIETRTINYIYRLGLNMRRGN